MAITSKWISWEWASMSAKWAGVVILFEFICPMEKLTEEEWKDLGVRQGSCYWLDVVVVGLVTLMGGSCWEALVGGGVVKCCCWVVVEGGKLVRGFWYWCSVWWPLNKDDAGGVKGRCWVDGAARRWLLSENWVWVGWACCCSVWGGLNAYGESNGVVFWSKGGISAWEKDEVDVGGVEYWSWSKEGIIGW